MEDVFTAQGVTIYRYVMPAILSNMYLILEGKQALTVDPNTDADALKRIKDAQPEKVTVLLTHEHFDHISGVNLLRQHFVVEVICLKECAEMLGDPGRNLAEFWDALIMDKSDEDKRIGERVKDIGYVCYADTVYEKEKKFTWCGHTVHMQELPGHSKGGSLIRLDGSITFTGDNLVNGKGVICRLPGGSKKEYATRTIPLLNSILDDSMIFPGHGKPERMGKLRENLKRLE